MQKHGHIKKSGLAPMPPVSLLCGAVFVQTTTTTTIANSQSKRRRENKYVVPLQDEVELVPRVRVLGVVGDAREPGDERVLRPDVQRVENLPVDVAHFPRRMEKSLKRKQEYIKAKIGYFIF